MGDLTLIDAVAQKTGEELQRKSAQDHVLTGPEDSGSNPESECLLDEMAVIA